MLRFRGIAHQDRDKKTHLNIQCPSSENRPIKSDARLFSFLPMRAQANYSATVLRYIVVYWF